MHLIKNRTLAVSMLIATFAILMIISPSIIGADEAFAKKQKKKHHNSSQQGIGQSQSSRQNSQCVAGGDLSGSCNNSSFQDQDNSGNNAAAQDGGGHGNGKNSGKQGIGQSQSSRQNSQCVAGGSLDSSCNNSSFQDQDNSGNNAAAQDGGGHGNGKNSGKQGIGQSQSSEQNAQCVSGEDAIVSCNNAEFQRQVNSGNNALGQN